MVTVAVEVAKKVSCVVCGKEKFALKSPYVCHSCWVSGEAALMIQRLTPLALDGATPEGFCKCGTSIEHHTGMGCLYRPASKA